MGEFKPEEAGDADLMLQPMEFLQPIEAIDTIDVLQTADVAKVESLEEGKARDGENSLSVSNTKGGAVDGGSKGDMAKTAKSQAAGSAASKTACNETAPQVPAEPVEEVKEEEPPSEVGCYLTFESVSEGTLFLNWSDKRVDGALAYFRPRKTVPKFKFKQNGGKSELMRNLRGGTGASMKRYFEAWVQFIKLSREYLSELVVWNAKDVALYYLNEHNSICELKTDAFLNVDDVDAITAMGPANTTFDGVATMTRDYFAGTGNREGAALLF